MIQRTTSKQAYGEIESFHPGFLLGQDTYYVGYIKGVWKIYQQTAIDTYSNIRFAKLNLEKTALAAADLLNDKVLPFMDHHRIPLLRVLTDQRTEYGYKTLEHPYQLFLHLNDIEHSRSKARHPQTNGCTERLQSDHSRGVLPDGIPEEDLHVARTNADSSRRVHDLLQLASDEPGKELQGPSTGVTPSSWASTSAAGSSLTMKMQ